MQRAELGAEVSGSTYKGASALVEAKEPVGGTGDADALATAEKGAAEFSCGTSGDCTQPEGTRSTKVCAVERAVNEESGREAAGTAGEVERARGLAVTLHLLYAFQGFKGTDQDATADSGCLRADIEHEMIAVGEIDVSVAAAEKHGAIARSGAAKVVRGGIARRVGLRFDNATAETSARKFADDDFADQKPSQRYGVQREFHASKAPDGKGSLVGCRG